MRIKRYNELIKENKSKKKDLLNPIRNVLETYLELEGEREYFYDSEIWEGLTYLIRKENREGEFFVDKNSSVFKQEIKDKIGELKSRRPIGSYTEMVDHIKEIFELDFNNLSTEWMPIYLQALYAKEKMDNLVPNAMKSINEDYSFSKNSNMYVNIQNILNYILDLNSEWEWFVEESLPSIIEYLLYEKGSFEQFINLDGSWTEESLEIFDRYFSVSDQPIQSYDKIVKIVKNNFGVNIDSLKPEVEKQSGEKMPFYLTALFVLDKMNSMVPNAMKKVNA